MADKIKEMQKEKHGNEIAEMDETGFEHSIFNLRNGDFPPVGLNFKFRFFRKRKNGEPEKRRTNADMLMMPSFCPFCGTEYKGEKKEG